MGIKGPGPGLGVQGPFVFFKVRCLFTVCKHVCKQFQTVFVYCLFGLRAGPRGVCKQALFANSDAEAMEAEAVPTAPEMPAAAAAAPAVCLFV